MRRAAARGRAVVRRRRGRRGRARRAGARALPRSCSRTAPAPSDWWGGLLESQVEALAPGPTYRLVHDDLSDHWAPVWFADFAGARGGQRARLRRRVPTSPTCCPSGCPTAVADGPGRDLRRRPDPPRAADRPAALRVLPPVRAVPRQPPAGRRARIARLLRDLHFAARAGRAGRRAAGRAARLRARAAALARAGHAGLRRAARGDRAPIPTSSREALHEGFLGRVRDAAPLAAAVALRRTGVERPRREPARALAGARRRPRSRASPTRPCTWRSRPRGCCSRCSTARATAPRSGPSSASAPGCRCRPRTSTRTSTRSARLFLLSG